VNATSTVTTVLNKGKQIWKPKGRLSDNNLYKTKRVWKATGKLFADIGYQWRPTGKKLTLGKLCDSGLEVAFRKHTCFVRDVKGTDILTGSRGTNLYTISIDEMMKSSPICLL
ncbi:hypothetical protein Tco_0447560, partial [Tanacetum coccineum]